jgi:hypothetical protein
MASFGGETYFDTSILRYFDKLSTGKLSRGVEHK